MLHSCLRVLADGWKFPQKTLRLLKRCYHRRSYRGRLLWVAPTEGPVEAQNMIFTFNRICPKPLFKTLTFICFSSILVFVWNPNFHVFVSGDFFSTLQRK